ncbi:MAG: hypothetical protein ACAH83_12400 [Alphaproteobacteria bacterium]
MTRDEFKAHVTATIEYVIRHAEQKIGRALPRRYCFNLFHASTPPIPEEAVVDFITDRVYIDSENIYPCFDIGVGDLLDDGRVLIVGNRAGFAPGPWQKNWTGRDGPFVPIIGGQLLAKFNVT